MADWKSGKGQKPTWHGQSAAPGRARKHHWKSAVEAAPGRGKRRLWASIVALMLLGVTSGIVIWALQFLKPPQPCLVLLSVNPQDQCHRLEGPLDLYGWLSARLLADQAAERNRQEQAGRWGSFAPRVLVDDRGMPKTIPTTDEALEVWAESLSPYDPLIIYCGTHTGTGLEGPFLFGPGDSRLSVRKLLETLNRDELRRKKKVLVLDPSRLPPNPIYGQMIDDFPGQMQQLDELVQACENLLVIVGCGPGERAWESEEQQSTPLALAVAEALNGAEGLSPDNDLITALELFGYVRQRVAAWTHANRPSASTPFLLPSGGAGEARAQAITLGVVPSAPAPKREPATLIDYSTLQLKWEEYDRLSAAQPSASFYQPRLWNRYRELLLRHLQAVRAGETSTANKLAVELNTCVERLKERTLPNLESGSNSLALQLATGISPSPRSAVPLPWLTDGSRPAPTDASSRLTIALEAMKVLKPETVPSPDSVRRQFQVTEAVAKLFPPRQRPIELHIPIMMQDFTRSVVPNGELASSWSDAVEIRAFLERLLLAQTATLAPTDQAAHPTYPEVVFDLIRDEIRKLDDLVFDAIDRSFSNDVQATAGLDEVLRSSRERMNQLMKEVQQVNEALHARNRHYASLYELALWRIHHQPLPMEEFNNLQAALLSLHADSAALDQILFKRDGEKPTTSVPNELIIRLVARDGTFEDLVKAFELAVDRMQSPQNIALQGTWQQLQGFLDLADLPWPVRERMLRRSREISARLNLGTAGTPAPQESAQQKSQAAIAIQRAKFALAWLGKDLMAANCARNPSLMRYESIEADLLKLAASGEVANLNQIGKHIAEHYRELAKAIPRADGIDPIAERYSRQARGCASDDHLEPAVVNQRLRWARLLNDLGERACRERWYDENRQPYFADTARRYFKDADKLQQGIVLRTTADQPDRRETMLADRSLQCLSAASPNYWTSELESQITFTVTVPNQFPTTGQAVVIHRDEKLAPLRLSQHDRALVRPLIPVASGGRTLITSDLSLERLEVKHAEAVAGLEIYFRGQRQQGNQEILLRREADLVIHEPLPSPSEAGVALAVRAAPDLDLGEIVVIVDYSGSMKGGIKDNEDFSKNDEYRRNKSSKFRMAMDSLRTTLQVLPFRTRLKIRIFADAEAPEGSRLVFGDRPGSEFTSWQPNNLGPLDRLMNLLESLEPRGFTPLVDSIIASAKEDFSSDRSRTKTIVVLTDGIDEAAGVTNTAARMEQLSARLYDHFKNSDITLLIVQFALGEEDLKLSKVLFQSLPVHRSPGRVWSASDQDRLKQDLMDALRPKLKLFDDQGGTPAHFPSSGWPTRTRNPGGDTRESLIWSPLLEVPPTGRFRAVPYPSALNIETELRVKNGDRLLLELAKVAERTVVRADLYADFFAENLKAESKNSLWMLTNSTLSVLDTRRELRGMLFLERKPPHRTGSSDRNVQIEQLTPDLIWWNIVPAAEDAPKTGTITLKRRYAFPAPAWELAVQNWPNVPGNTAAYMQARISVLPVDRPAKRQIIEINPALAVQEETTPEGDRLELRHAIEPHAIGPDGEKIPCLVIRIKHAPNRKVRLLPAMLAQNLNQEHAYFQSAGVYTAKFGRITAETMRSNPPRFELITEEQSRMQEDSRMSLVPPRPAVGSRLEKEYRPVLIQTESSR